MDAVTALSGSGPAYVFLLAECMAKAGEAAGLAAGAGGKACPRDGRGAGELLHRSDLDPAELRRNVTSPGGTTAAALSVLMGQAEAAPARWQTCCAKPSPPQPAGRGNWPAVSANLYRDQKALGTAPACI